MSRNNMWDSIRHMQSQDWVEPTEEEMKMVTAIRRNPYIHPLLQPISQSTLSSEKRKVTHKCEACETEWPVSSVELCVKCGSPWRVKIKTVRPVRTPDTWDPLGNEWVLDHRHFDVLEYRHKKSGKNVQLTISNVLQFSHEHGCKVSTAVWRMLEEARLRADEEGSIWDVVLDPLGLVRKGR